MPKGKVCTFCEKELPITEFYERKDRQGGLRANCRSCGNKRSKRYYRAIEERNTGLKTCIICGETKQLSDFYKRNEGLYRRECKVCVRGTMSEHYYGSEGYRENQKDNARNRYAQGKTYKLERNLRHRLYIALKGNSTDCSAVRDLGCSIGEFKLYVSNYFKLYPGMTWNNYGKEWHLDHYIPLSSFDLTDETQVKEACHYTNLQPLWSGDNLKKHNATPDCRGV